MRTLREKIDNPIVGRYERKEIRVLLEALETVRGDVYLWRLGEIDAEKAMEGVRDAVGF
jgi:hypothetical protein